MSSDFKKGLKMTELVFRASPMVDIYKANDNAPEYFTVLCREKNKKKWMYCGDSNGNQVKFDTLSEAEDSAIDLSDKYQEKMANELDKK